MNKTRILGVVMGVMLMFATMPVKAQKWEHLADTPQMGWSTWNSFRVISLRISSRALPT